MQHATHNPRDAVQDVKNHPEHAGSWLEILARVGYAAIGIVYAVIGFLALRAAFGQGGKTTDTKGALTFVDTGPAGTAILAVIAVGLLGYAAWRVLSGITDSEDKGADFKGIASRAGHVASGLAYLGLAVYAGALALNRPAPGGGNSSSQSTQDWTARILALPFGQVLVIAGGALAVILGGYFVYLAFKAEFRKKLDLSDMNADLRRPAILTGQVGVAARGIVTAVIGVFLVKAALESNPKAAVGLDQSLQKLAHTPAGPWVLAVVAAGLVAYGVYCFIEARYRTIREVHVPGID